MPLFAPRSPVEERERQWIEKMLAWCVEQFGAGPLAAEVLSPTPQFFPGRYEGTPEDVYDLVDLVRAYLRVDPDEIEVRLYDQRTQQPPEIQTIGSSIAGHYQVRNGRGIVSVGLEDAPDPRRVVAVAAHELCHHKLLYTGLVSPAEPDHEPLTDLATVFFGVGVFTANAAFTFNQGARGWQRRKLGYLNQPMFGYALASVAHLRGETNPAWARHLDTNPRGYFKQGTRYLAKNAATQ
jgi:hypothetical protein